MRILFLGINYSPELIGIAVYSTGLCEGLVRLGHEVRVVAGKPYYPDWRVADGFGGKARRTLENGVDVTRCRLYIPRKPSGIRRILHHASFALWALFPMIRAARALRPDVVITVAPSLVAAPVAWLAAKAAGARSWLHFQDFEAEAAVATGLLSANSFGARLAGGFERRVIRLFDQVSSISPEMCGRLAKFGVPADRTFELRNWAADAVQPLEAPSTYRSEWGITTRHVALYSGNIANKQGIEIVLEAARELRSRSDLTFVICGAHSQRAALRRQVGGLENIRFHDLQPLERLGELLGLATVHLLPQKAAAADLVLPSKLGNMLASGRPVVATAAANTGLAREVSGCGLIVPPGNGKAFAQAIEQLIDSPELHRACSAAARRRGEQAWDRERIIVAAAKKLESLADDPSS